MSTVRDLLHASCRLLGVIAVGETLSADEQTDCLYALKTMIDGWSNESLTIFSKVREEFTLTPSKQTYTIGLDVTADFNTTRPQKIENALIKVFGTPDYELPIEIFNQDQWANILVKDVTSSIPRGIYNDNANPLSNLSIWPIPSDANALVLWSWKPLTNFSSPDDLVIFPPGYERAIRYNLALELAPEFGVQPREDVAGIAVMSKAEIKRMNIKPLYLKVDEAIVGTGRPFNWLTGDSV